MKVTTKEEALEHLRYICSKSEKCLYDIRKKLVEWNLSEEYDLLSNILLEENYINELRYTQSFVNDKIKFSKWGKIKLSYNLKMRGIKNEHINKAFSEFPDNEYLLIIKKEIEKKSHILKETDKYKRWQKLSAFAAQRGFESDISRNIIDKILSKAIL